MVSVANNEDSAAPAPSPTFVSRVTSIPVVSEAFSAVNSAVNTLSVKNKYAKYALDTTNNAVNSVVNTASKYAEPYQQRFGPQISKVDETASRMLDIVEEKFPIITQPPAQVFSNARGAVNQVKSSVTSSKPVTSASNAVKNLESVLASVMDNVEIMVEKYLPEDVASQNEAAVNGENGTANGSAPNGQVARAVNISIDVQKRLARMLLAQIKQLQETIPEATHELLKMKESSHLLNTATDSIRSLNDKLTRVLENLRESGVERAKALDAQFEISNRVEPIIKSALGEVAALTDYVHLHIPGMKASRSTAAVAEMNIESSEVENDNATEKLNEE